MNYYIRVWAIHFVVLGAVKNTCWARRHQVHQVHVVQKVLDDLDDSEDKADVSNPLGEKFASMVNGHHVLGVKAGKLESLKKGNLTCGCCSEKEFECNNQKHGIADYPEDAEWVVEEGRMAGFSTSFLTAVRNLGKHILNQELRPEAKEMFMEWYRARTRKSKDAFPYDERMELVLAELEHIRLVRNIERLFKKFADADNLVPIKVLMEAIQSKVPAVFRNTVTTSLRRSVSFFSEEAKINFNQFASQKLVLKWLMI